ncbi:hypothetical protein [Yersinia alsatica]|uniref:hypothetical protein n=1 Tax=Yersinia alsatica TaxID=2890317 RepID=UPI00119DE944|nr:hypothetical protein [Yersinia alsatica]
MDVLYRSDKCQREVYDEKTESHVSMDRGKNPQVISMIRQGGSDIWQRRIAFDGGGKCEWKLSTVRVDLQLINNTSLTKEKDITSTSYVFAFDDEFYNGGGLPGLKKDVRGNFNINTDFFPMIYINHTFKETYIEMFGGNVKNEKWSRHYRVYNTKNIIIEPTLHIQQVVKIENSKNKIQPANMTIIYPDGTIGHERTRVPDYEKLLSMK